MTDNIINDLENVRYHLTASKHKQVIDDVIDLINRQSKRIKALTNSRDNWRRIAEEFDKASRETEKEVESLQAEIERLKWWVNNNAF